MSTKAISRRAASSRDGADTLSQTSSGVSSLIASKSTRNQQHNSSSKTGNTSASTNSVTFVTPPPKVTVTEPKTLRTVTERPSPRHHHQRVSSAASSRASSSAGSVSSVDETPIADGKKCSDVNKISSGYLQNGLLPLAQLGFRGSRHYEPDRLPSPRKQLAVGLRLMDKSLNSLENLRIMSQQLKRLELNKLGLTAITKDLIEGLSSLQKLDVAHNKLDDESFPEAMKFLDELKEIRVDYNNISRLPTVLRRLKNITRLSASNNRLQNVKGIEKLKKVTSLVLENNKLASVFGDIKPLRRLELCYLAGNVIRDVPPDVKNLRYLKEIDISRNRLTYLPPEIFTLPRLDYLNASLNKIDRLPTINVRRPPKRRIAAIDLSDNKIVRFPEHLILMSKDLDLSNNVIKSINGNLIKKLSYDTDKRVNVEGNPLINPPLDICECGLRAMVQYFQELNTGRKTYQGIKVFTVGAFMSGKTSMIQTLLDELPRLENEQDRTVGLDIFDVALETADLTNQTTPRPAGAAATDIKLEEVDNNSGEEREEVVESKPLNLSIWDLSGNTFYQCEQYFFLEPPCLIILCFNVAEYNSRNFYEKLGIWIDWLLAKLKHLIVIVVGTHADLVPDAQALQVCAEVKESISRYIDEHLKTIERDVQEIKQRTQISPALTEQYKLYMNLLKLQQDIYPDVIAFSSATMRGMDELVTAIKTMAMNKTLFPQVMRVIPSLWLEVENLTEEHGNLMPVPIMKWSEFVDMASAKCGMRHLMTNIVEFLHNSGKIFYDSNHPAFRDNVVLRSSFIPEVMHALMRHDVTDVLDYAQEDCFKAAGLGVKKFIQYKEQYVKESVLEKDMLKAMASNAIPFEGSFYDAMEHLNKYFEVGYPLGKRLKNGGYILTPHDYKKDTELNVDKKVKVKRSRSKQGINGSASERQSRSAEKVNQGHDKDATSSGNTLSAEATEEASDKDVSRTLLAWLRHTDEPENVRSDWNYVSVNPGVCILYRFPRYIPPGLFQRITVRLHHPRYQLQYLAHWKLGMMAKHAQYQAALRVSNEGNDDGSSVIRVDLRHLGYEVKDEDTERKETEILWIIMLQVLANIERLLEQFPGAYFQRLMECPRCKEASFIGEWLTPKELQNLDTKPCQSCGEEVNTLYLVPPKEKRGKEILKIKRERSLHRMESDEQGGQKQTTASADEANNNNNNNDVVENRSDNQNKPDSGVADLDRGQYTEQENATDVAGHNDTGAGTEGADTVKNSETVPENQQINNSNVQTGSEATVNEPVAETSTHNAQNRSRNSSRRSVKKSPGARVRCRDD
ncbi:uncharacterized protein LOC141910751 [Tubulanus polymorphus]|uniref:uncharacterized protein LOC141910751 n=1 Tax=Tubulanus polymorphus TaxID=672921 RepID=UPI003DA3DA89